MNIFFRVDSSSLIGTGHIMRCLTVAKALKILSHQIFFITRLHSGHVAPLIRENGFEALCLEGSQSENNIGLSQTPKNYAHWLGVTQGKDAEETISFIKQLNGTVALLIVDHYAIDSKWERLLYPFVEKLCVVDDLASRQHYCDLLLDQTFNRKESDYNGLLQHNCELFLGAEYSLLRPEFSQCRSAVSVDNAKKKLKKIFIFLGNPYSELLLCKILKALQATGLELIIDLVIGNKLYGHNNLLKVIDSISLTCNLCFYLKNIEELMSQADLAIGAGGITVWERCCLGLPSLVIKTAENQTDNIHALLKVGAIEYLGDNDSFQEEKLTRSIKKFAEHLDLLSEMSHLSAGVCDGYGVGRLMMEIFQEKTTDEHRVRLRPVTLKDKELTYAWQIDPSTRRYFRNTQLPSYEEHIIWFDKQYRDPNRLFYIIQYNRQSVGVLRLDKIICKQPIYEVSILIDPGYKNRGIAKCAILLARKLLYFAILKAKVSVENKASHALFKSAGFVFRNDYYYAHANSVFLED